VASRVALSSIELVSDQIKEDYMDMACITHEREVEYIINVGRRKKEISRKT
jgi:hypothetical protein